MTKAYRFKDWDRIYENNKSREVETLSYFCQPNKLVGECLGYTKMQPDGLELMGTLTFLKCVASTSQPAKWRGWFVRNGSAMDAVRIAALTGLPVEKITRALTFFSTPPMDWLLEDEWPGSKMAHGGHKNGTSPAHGRQTKVGKSAGLTDKGLSTDEAGTGERERPVPSAAEIQASRTQAGALLAQIREMEARKASLTTEERADLRKKRRALAALQEQQAAGDFSTQPTT